MGIHRAWPALAAAAATLLAGLATSVGQARPAAAPTRYSVTETLFLVVEGQVMKIGRDGPRAVIEQTLPANAGSPAGVRSRAYYDLKASLSYTLDLIDPATPCAPSRFTGEWGDPFAMSADLIAQMAKFHPRDAGSATVNGLAAEVSVATTSDGEARFWVEPKTGLIVKWVMTPPHGSPRTMIEVTSLSLTPPPPAALALPAKCA
ncbi:MAG TPA: hypothetical protein VGH15_13725 [Caulobacteraceae bacterium]|jgi:hypothetical protein